MGRFDIILEGGRGRGKGEGGRGREDREREKEEGGKLNNCIHILEQFGQGSCWIGQRPMLSHSPL